MINEQEFLDQYWQKKPCVIRKWFPEIKDSLSPDELAGLSCEPDVQSRIVLEDGPDYPWQVMHGPFDEERFQNLPDKNWSLLVQGVDQWVPGIYQLIESFGFLPQWRIDDIMVSYAPDGGSVGPHTDHYDVFLIQGQGSREWKVGKEELKDPKFIEGLDLRILETFDDFDSYELECGDVLYLPPGYAHWGTSKGDAMTFSVGFRAPQVSELLTAYCDRILLKDKHDYRIYKDPQLQACDLPGRIHSQVFDSLKKEVIDSLYKDDSFDHFLAWYLSCGRTEVEPEEQEESLFDELADNDLVEAYTGARFTYFQREDIYLFVSGSSWTVSSEVEPLVEALCSRRMSWKWSELRILCKCEASLSLLKDLFLKGWLILSEEGQDIV